VPVTLMAGYTNAPLYKKLGVRPGDLLVLLDSPPDWTVPGLPNGVRCVTDTSPRPSMTSGQGAERGGPGAKTRGQSAETAGQSAVRDGQGADEQPHIIVAFFGALEGLRESIPTLSRRIFPAGALWIAWPRRAGGQESDIREHDIRSLALALGLVDVKVAALDEDWSGLRLVWRRDRRQASRAACG
jgi:hypothetical protein